MTDDAFKAIAQVATLLTVLASLGVSLMNRRLNRRTADRLETVHQDVNGKMQQLIEARQAEAKAAGEIAGREKAISERADRVTESERVEDRLASIEKTVVNHDQWERETKK